MSGVVSHLGAIEFPRQTSLHAVLAFQISTEARINKHDRRKIVLYQ